jgi:hypothetical protein
MSGWAGENPRPAASTTSCTSPARDRHRFFDYGLGVPAGASVPGIQVRLDARADSTNGAHSLTARAFDAAGNQATSAAVGVTVNNGSPPVLDITLSGVPASIRRGQFLTGTGTVANTGGTAASGYTVLVSFTPADSMRLESPQSSSQSVAAVAAGGTQSVSWQIRADRAASATLTMTLRNSSGATVDAASQAISITD